MTTTAPKHAIVSDVTLEVPALNKKRTLKNTLKVVAAVAGVVLVGLFCAEAHNRIDKEIEESTNE